MLALATSLAGSQHSAFIAPVQVPVAGEGKSAARSEQHAQGQDHPRPQLRRPKGGAVGGEAAGIAVVARQRIAQYGVTHQPYRWRGPAHEPVGRVASAERPTAAAAGCSAPHPSQLSSQSSARPSSDRSTSEGRAVSRVVGGRRCWPGHDQPAGV